MSRKHRLIGMRTSGAGVGEGRNYWRQGQFTNASTQELTERVLRRGSQGQSFLLWGDLHHHSVQRTSDIGQKSALDEDKDSIIYNVLSKAIRKLTK